MFDESQTDTLTGFSGDQPSASTDTSQVSRQLPADANSAPPSTPPKQVSQQFSAEPFIPSRADRPHNQWAQPDFALQGAMNYPGYYRGPLMPQMHDIAGLIHGAVMGLGRFGSRYTGMPAIAMGTYASAYWAAYQKGMNQRAGQAYQQYRQARQMTIDRGKEEMLEYAKIYATYYKDGKITDVDGFKSDLLQAAKKYQNHAIENQIESGNIGAAERIIQATDSHVMNLIKAQHQEERQKLQDELLRRKLRGDELPPEWGGHGKGESSIPDTNDTDIDTEPEPDSEPDADAGAGADASSDTESGASAKAPTRLAEADLGTKTDAGGSTRIAQETPHVATPEEVNKRIDDYAHGELRGEAIPKNIPKSIAGRIEARKEDLERQLEDIANSGATGQDMLNKVRAFDPQTARTIEDLASGARAVQPGGIGGGQQALWNRLTSIVRAVRPGWGPEVASFRKEFTEANGYSQKVLTNSSSMAEAAKRVLMALQYIGEDFKPPSNWLDQIVSRKLTGDPYWVNLGTALNVYVEEATRLARSAGGAEADIRRVLEQYAPMGMGPKAVRALLSNDAAVASAQVQAQLTRWKSVTGEKNPPLSFDPVAFGDLKTLENIDMMTGLPRPGAPPPSPDLKPLLGPAGTKIGDSSGAKEGDRKQFKQGWGVFRNGKWVPE